MKVSILGMGVTGQAVSRQLKALAIDEVSPESADLLVVSPGIPPAQFPTVSAEIVSEIEFAYRLFQKQAKKPVLIGVTGTNGKTTNRISSVTSFPPIRMTLADGWTDTNRI